MEFAEYQELSAATDILGTSLVMPLMGLAGEVGSLVAEYKKYERDKTGYKHFTSQVREELGDLLWYCAALARRTDIELEAVAAENLVKARGRFHRPASPPPLTRLDAGAPSDQQLPDDITFVFSQHITANPQPDEPPLRTVAMKVDGIQVGDHLDDNSIVDDQYRFHDAFHIANMVYLGWSPVMRSLLKRKRKYSASADRTEDGARSIAIEEGLTAFVFAAAEGHSRFRTANRVPWDLVKYCIQATAHLEVSVRTPADWEYAILNGYRVFNSLTEHGGGTVHADLKARTLVLRNPAVDL